MTVIIPYKNDFAGGQELLYSIRSLVKHFRAMTGLILVGDLPQWFTGDYLLYKDIPLRKEYSLYNKAMAGAVGLTEFLYTHDDHFCLTDFDESLPNYYISSCADAANNHRAGKYRTMYRNCPEGWLNYDCHVPIVMRPFTWPSTNRETDTPIKSTYANSAGVIGTQLADCKFFNGFKYEEIKNVIADKPFFSTSPFSQSKGMVDVLRELYPDKSKYEK